MSAEASITVGNDLAELDRLSGFLMEFCDKNGLTGNVVLDLNLVAEEVVMNVILHGGEEAGKDGIRVNIRVDETTVELTVEDSGIAFNPLDVPPINVDAPIEERGIGGLGVHLIRNLMNQVEYSNVDGRNRLVMKKRIPRRGQST
jgi:serine/threonine-protein kinase RsbW